MPKRSRFGISIMLAAMACCTLVIAPSQAQIPTNGLVAYYPFNRGTANDSSGNGNNGSIVIANRTMNMFGDTGKALYFNGLSSYVDCGHGASLNSASALTLSAWIKTDTLAGMIISKKNYTGGYELHIFNQWIEFGYNGNQYLTYNISSLLNTWIHIAVTYDGTNSILFVNGVGSTPYGTPALINPDSVNLTIGKPYGLTTDRFRGSIDEVRIYNRALSTAEIQSLYQQSKFVAYYTYTGNTVDSSYNNNDGNPNLVTLTSDRFGGANKAYDFSGTNTYIKSKHSGSLNFTNTLSFSAWIKPRSLVNSTILSKRNLATDGYTLGTYTTTDSVSYLGLAFNGSWVNTCDITAYLNRWIFVVATYDGNRTRIYVDGTQRGMTTCSTIINPDSADLFIGSMYGTVGFFNGAIDEVRLYNRALRVGEIDTLYRAGGWTGHPVITAVTPMENALNVAKNTSITVLFQEDNVSPTSISASTVKIYGSLSGRHTFSTNYTSSTKTARLLPDAKFETGELVTVTATKGIKSPSGETMVTAKTWSFVVTSGIATGTFTEGLMPAGGNGPTSSASGDLDGDGDIDLAVANNSTNSMAILANDGAGSFTVSSTPGNVNAPWSVIAEDLDGDGDLDLAVANAAGNNLSILTNNGSGTFTLGSTPSVAGSSPLSVAAGDFDGDGDFDLATANNGSGTISILLNNGSGAFTIYDTLGVGTSPRTIVAGDFDGDGDLDLAVTNYGSNSVSILFNVGYGNFMRWSTVTVGTNPWSLVAQDFDGDGDLDLAVTNQNSNSTSILLNNGGGLFTLTSSPSAGNGPSAITASDLDGDGDIDLVVGDQGTNTTTTLINNGTGTFTSYAGPAVGPTPMSMSAGDFNGDGRIDIAVGNNASNTISLLINGYPTPRSLFVNVAGSNINLSWQCDGSPVRYRIYRGLDSTNMTLIDSATSLNYTASTGITMGTQYYFRVSAVNASGTESTPSPAAVVFPDVPGTWSLACSPGTDIRILSGPQIGSNRLAIEAWIYLCAMNQDTAVIFKRVGSDVTLATPIYALELRRPSAGMPPYVDFRISDGTDAGVVSVSSQSNGTSIPVYSWTHVAGVYDGSVIRVYINGFLQGAQVASRAFPIQGEIRFGASVYRRNTFHGFVDEMRLWDTTRTDVELQSGMNGISNPATVAHLLGCWKFEDATNQNYTPSLLCEASGHGITGIYRGNHVCEFSHFDAPGTPTISLSPTSVVLDTVVEVGDVINTGPLSFTNIGSGKLVLCEGMIYVVPAGSTFPLLSGRSYVARVPGPLIDTLSFVSNAASSPTRLPVSGGTVLDIKRFDVNSISTPFTRTGKFAFDPYLFNAGFEWPKGSSHHAVFQGGLWLAGQVGVDVRTAAASYNPEFRPGHAQGGTPVNPSSTTYRVYKINRGDNGSNPDYAAWPGSLGAPVNSDGTPKLLGDQELFTVYNDYNALAHLGTYGTNPLGAEVQQVAYGFNTPGTFSNTIFLQYKIINRSTDTWNNAYAAFWADPDLGYMTDDFIGCDSINNFSYAYNGSPSDTAYGSNPPAIGFVYLSGPLGNKPMASSVYFAANSAVSDPTNGIQVYNLLQGLKSDGSPIMNPVTGSSTRFMLTGTPETATGWVDASPGDRRVIVSSGPFNLAPGQSTDVTIAVVIARGTDYMNSVAKLRQAVIEVQAFGASSTPPAAPRILSASPGNTSVTLTWTKNTEPDVQRYRIYVGTSSNPTTVFDSTNTANDTVKAVMGLGNGTLYYFRIKAVDFAGNESNYSTEMSARPQIVAQMGEYASDGKTVLLMHMNESSGSTVNDNSGPNNSGTAGTGATVTAQGRFGNARFYDGTLNAYVQVPSSPSLTFGIGSFTAETWVKTTSSMSTQRLIFRNTGITNRQWSLDLGFVGPVGTLSFDGLGSSCNGSTPLNDGRWHHVAVIKNGTNVSLYADGKFEASTTVALPDTNLGSLYIGGVNYNPAATLDEVRISSSPRNPVEFDLQLPPKGLRTNVSGNSVTLSWTYGGGGVPLMKYRIYQGPDSTSMTLVDSTTGATMTKNGLAPGRYYCRVAAVDSTGFESAKSYAVSATITSPLVMAGEYIADANTVLLMHMNETAGSAVNDMSGRTNNGDAMNTTIVGGRFGNVREFSGSNCGITINANLLGSGNDSYTLEGWIYPHTVGSSQSHPIFSQRNSSVEAPVIEVSLGGAGEVDFQFRNDSWGAFDLLTNSIFVPLNRWTHIAVVKNASTSSVDIFINGVRVKSGTLTNTGTLSGLNTFTIGKKAWGTSVESFDGLIEEVRISDRARQAFEFNLQLPPRALAANPSNNSVRLSWQNGGGAVPLMRYKIYRGADSTSLVPIDSTTQLTYNSVGLTAGLTYFYRVTAVDSTGFEGARSYAVSAAAGSGPSIPAISSVTPSAGPVGTAVTISGSNFNSTASNNVVYFGAVKAVVNSATSGSLNVTVPFGATYRPISVTDLTTGLTAFSTAPFNVTFPSLQTIDATSFIDKTDFTAGATSGSIAVSDLDGDGKPDLAVTNSGSNTVSIFRNISTSGSITSSSFAPKIDFSTGASPTCVAIGDVNGDGRPDLIVTNQVENTISIFRNACTPGSIAAGSFDSKIDFATGTSPSSVALGDIDGDGKSDLVVTNSYSNTVSILRNTVISASDIISASSFAAKVDIATGTNPLGVAVGDMDGDGYPDIVVTNNISTVAIFRNISTIGTVSFDPRVDFTAGTNLWSFPALGDIDGDTKPDVVVANVNDNGFSVFRNISVANSITTSSFEPKVDFALGSQPVAVVLGDLDGNGKPDLVVIDQPNNALSVFRNTGSAGSITTSSFASKVNFATGSVPNALIICDLDGDGKPDLAVANAMSNSISVYRNNLGTADITPPTITFDPISVSTAVVLADGTLNSVSPTISATASDEMNGSGLKKMTLQYRQTGNVNWQFNENLSGSISYPLPSNLFAFNNHPIGVDYRIGAEDNAGNVGWTSVYSVDISIAQGNSLKNPTALPSANTFPTGERFRAYRVFSVPYDLDDKKPSSMMSNWPPHENNSIQYSRWRMVRYVNQSPEDYENFRDQDAITPGSAFFFITTEQGLALSVGPGKVVKANLMNDVGIPLGSGWNLVGNPLLADIPFDSLRFDNGTIQDHAYYSGTGTGVSGWEKTGSNANVLRSWQGLAIRVNNAGNLKFKSFDPLPNIIEKSDRPRSTDIASVLKKSAANWLVSVDAQRTDIGMQCIGSSLGMIDGASEKQDEFDSYMPPFVGDKNVAIYFSNPDGAMMRDVRPLNDSGSVWPMRVITGDERARVKLQFGDVAKLPVLDFEAYLIDLDQKMAFNLKKVSTVEINSGDGTRNLNVVIGRHAFVEQNNSGVELNPSVMRLYENYPNPFNPETVIRFTVPNAAPAYQVTLKVFNIVGQEVATLVNDQRTSGYYEARWDARGRSSGVYFYRLTMSDGLKLTSAVKKMVMVK